MIIYYDSKTGNVKRFIDKLAVLKPNWKMSDIRDGQIGSGHLITYTAANGEVPTATMRFLQSNYKAVLSVSASGNRNWGSRFANAADKIHDKFDIPIAIKFELSGFESDVEFFMKYVEYFKSSPTLGHNDSKEICETSFKKKK